MSKVKCPFEYCKWNKKRICSKPQIELGADGCLNWEIIGLDKVSIDKIVNHIKFKGEK